MRIYSSVHTMGMRRTCMCACMHAQLPLPPCKGNGSYTRMVCTPQILHAWACAGDSAGTPVEGSVHLGFPECILVWC